MSREPTGFAYRLQGSAVVIEQHAARATVLRGRAAERFLAEVEDRDPQELMARVTGNYRRGNERLAKEHPRNARSGERGRKRD